LPWNSTIMIPDSPPSACGPPQPVGANDSFIESQTVAGRIPGP
jgi:hypothetical protein